MRKYRFISLWLGRTSCYDLKVCGGKIARSGLTNEGMALAHERTEEIKSCGINRIFRGPGKANKQTAEIYAKTLGVEPKKFRILSGVRLPAGRTLGFMLQTLPDFPEGFVDLWLNGGWPGLESPDDFISRIQGGIWNWVIPRLREDEVAMIVCDQEVIWAANQIANSIGFKKAIKELSFASLIKFIVDADSPLPF